MRLSTRARYGTRALLDLATHRGEKPVQLKDIAGRQDISLNYLEHIIGPLVGAGIIKSVRGVGGGLRLTRQPKDIRLSELIQLLEGATEPVDCIGNPENCDRADTCITRDVWREVKKAIDATLESVTLQDLVEKQKRKETPVKQSV